MSAKSRIQHVIDKYRLFTVTVLETPVEGKVYGKGPIMAPETLDKFVSLDPSGNCKYLDWMIFAAGGGQDVLDRMLVMWDGSSAKDPHSMRNQVRAEFIAERTSGYEEDGQTFPPVSEKAALEAWTRSEEKYKVELLLGDQDVAFEDGYGFFRYWPGRDGVYDRVVETVTLWHASQAKLKSSYVNTRGIDLDIYAGWKPNSLSQSGAVYKTLNDLLRPLAGIRKLKAERDVRFETVYEDSNVLVVCPLTMAASLKFGCTKWCTSNRSEFERAFEPHNPGPGNWKTYASRGPVVYMNWKCPMPEWLSKIALHIDKTTLALLGTDDVRFVDVKNEPGGVPWRSIAARILEEHICAPDHALSRRIEHRKDDVLRWGNRKPGYNVWSELEIGRGVLQSFSNANEAIIEWIKTFDTKRIVQNYASVDNV